MSELLVDYLADNLVSLLSLLGLLMFLKFNVMLSKAEVRRMSLTMVLILVMFVNEAVFRCEEALDHPEFLHYLTNVIGYSLRPFAVLIIGTMSFRLTRKEWLIALIPAVANTVITFISIFTPIVFSYDEANLLVRGPLGYLPHVIGAIYLAMFVVSSVLLLRARHNVNAAALILILLCCLSALVLETFTDARALNQAIVASLIIYYIHFLTYHYRVDPLTGALTRKIFYLDAEREARKITAAVSFDVNGLKQINDRDGHVAGDAALVSIADSVRSCLSSGFRFYRIGGDEFAVLCFGKTREDIDIFAKMTAQALSKTPYSAAIGIAVIEPGETVDALMQRADAKMYINKKEVKGDTSL